MNQDDTITDAKEAELSQKGDHELGRVPDLSAGRENATHGYLRGKKLYVVVTCMLVTYLLVALGECENSPT